MILIALGSNLPGAFHSPEDALRQAVQALQDRGVHILSHSSIWITEPDPPSDQPLYRNAVIRVESDLPAPELMTLLLGVETELGRVRMMKNEARTLDLDLLAYNDLIIEGKTDSNDLYLPHPRLHQRSFVLLPLQEIAPMWVHPKYRLSVSDMIQNLPDDDPEMTTKKVPFYDE